MIAMYAWYCAAYGPARHPYLHQHYRLGPPTHEWFMDDARVALAGKPLPWAVGA